MADQSEGTEAPWSPWWLQWRPWCAVIVWVSALLFVAAVLMDWLDAMVLFACTGLGATYFWFSADWE